MKLNNILELFVLFGISIFLIGCFDKEVNRQKLVIQDQDSLDYEYWQKSSVDDPSRDTVYTWIEEYANGKTDTIFLHEGPIIEIKINKTLQLYELKHHRNYGGGFRIPEVKHDTVYINYSDNKIINNQPFINLDPNGLLSLLDTVFINSINAFEFPYNNLSYSFIDKPDWLEYHQTEVFIDGDGDIHPGFHDMSHNCQEIHYPKRVSSSEIDYYNFFCNSDDLIEGVYNWKLIATNAYGFRQVVNIKTAVVKN